MPINNITQTISTIPPAGARGVDVQTLFVTKQEDFQDHLQGVTVAELNILKDQFNSRISEINSTATTMNGYANTASAGASTATTKAGEASTSASGALTSKNQANTFATNSSNSATKASQWADNNYNVEVETGKYSAKHWATEAQNVVVNKVSKVTSTDNAIVRFDGTTGAVQNSGVIIDDNNNVSAKGLIINSGEDISPSSSGTGHIKIAGNGYNGYITLDASGMHIGNNSAARTLTFDVDEIEQMTIDSYGNLGIKVPSNPNYAIDTGSTKGVKVALFNIIRSGAGYPAYGFNVRSTATTSVYNYDKADSASVVELGDRSWTWKTAVSGSIGSQIPFSTVMSLNTNGDLIVPHTYLNTTASAANMFIDSAGKFFRSTSSKQYKKDIETIDKAYADAFFDNARPIYYKSLSENDNPNWGYWGFIAEEIAEFDKRLVHWRYQTKDIEVEKERVIPAIEEIRNEKDEITQKAVEETIEKYIEIEQVKDESKPMVAEGVMYERITVLLTAKVQEQQKIINDLISRIETLEGAN